MEVQALTSNPPLSFSLNSNLNSDLSSSEQFMPPELHHGSDDAEPKCRLISDVFESPAVIVNGGHKQNDGPESLSGDVDSVPEAHATAALKVQKVYKSYRIRRRLADSAVVAEELWWQAIDFARLNHSTISFFNYSKTEKASSKWNRVGLNASKVGKGLSLDSTALKLAFQHWIEAIDPRHRYGHNLHMYYDYWCNSNSGQPFFFWLDVGDGKDLDLEECPRSKLRKETIKYLGPQEREDYEYILDDGKIVHKLSKVPLDTNEKSKKAKWIFVVSTSKKLYAGEKKKGKFQHSSFLAGGATFAAGRLVVEHGILKTISPHSGHYRPTVDRFDRFLQYLKKNGVNLDEVEIGSSAEDYSESSEDLKSLGINHDVSSELESHQSESFPPENEKPPLEEPNMVEETQPQNNYKRTLSGGLQSPRAEVPKKAILERINSKKAASSYELGHQLCRRWCTGAGPRIGCVADYPAELRVQALEFVDLSPRNAAASPTQFRRPAGFSSPRASPVSV